MDPKPDHVEDVLIDGVERLHVHAQAQHDHKPEHYDGDSEQEDDNENDTEESVQLGFAEPYDGERALFSNPDWRDWDGGKIGGKPIWLDPQHLPTVESMSCPMCEEPLCFVLQIYCPLDAPAEAFHRALYVFCCRKPGCTAAGCVKVLRCQLPRSNRFYPHSPDKGGAPSVSSEALPTLCGLCGMRGEKVCAGCKAVKYCSRLHQKEHWKAGHRNRCKVMQQQSSDAGGAAVADIRPAGPEKEMLVPRSIFPEMEIVIGDDGDDGTRKYTMKQKNRENETLLKKYSDVYVKDATDDDAKLGQKDLDEASGANHAVKDPQTIRFLTTISMSPQQVIRYARWEDGSSPLWVSSEDQPGTREIPRCPHCRAERKFEFQIMPQLLHYLRVDSKAVMPGAPGQPCRIGALDWGTLAVYTCTKSCCGGAEGQHGGGYVEEFVWRQKPLD